MNNQPIHFINGASSVVLDGLRLGSALVVLLHHAYEQWFPHSQPLANAAHAAVVLFFALSGYVISYTTATGNRGALRYAQMRLSRLCSVLWPVLLLTVLIEMWVRFADPSLSNAFTRGAWWPRYLLTGAFLNEVWFFSASPPLNGPLWSLAYEFWYYLIFGLWFYAGRGTKWLLVVLACLMAGPKILALMPIWLAGCAAYRLPKPKLNAAFSWCAVAVLLLAAGLAVAYLPPLPYKIDTLPFFYANQFITD